MSTLESLLVITAAAALAPLIVDAILRVRFPVAVVEIAVGMIIGPQLLGLAEADAVVDAFSQFGLALLFFLAGFEIDLNRIRGRPLNLAAGSWLLSLSSTKASASAFSSPSSSS